MTAPSQVDPLFFRQLLCRFATGVTVITTKNEHGKPVGMTASSLASVSLSPPLISVCIDMTADMHRALAASGTFVINILAADQQEVSARFARDPADQRFDGIAWEETNDGHILLSGTLAHISCERYADFPLGDHTLFVGRVTGGASGEGQPLLYYHGRYAALKP